MFDLAPIGFTKKPYGRDGFIRYSMEDQYTDVLRENEFIFFHIEGCKVPFQMIKIDFDNNSFLLDEIDSPELGRQFSNKEIYIERSKLSHLDDRTKADQNSLIDYSIIDLNTSKTIGQINRIESYPQQIMAVIMKGDSEILIPLAEELIHEVSQSERTIVMELPEGLVDL